MSISTEIASLETLALIHRTDDMEYIYNRLVYNFRRVSHFDWIGLYILEGSTLKLKASSNDTGPFSLARKSILQVPIKVEGHLLGKILVMGRPSIHIDESDHIAVEKVTEEIGKKLRRIAKPA
ncbi:hypothetical protein [Aneurinibacillus tyrosinisolvens]|uniref:hypothetical protein n=1 Tax=Aneurinibacillus tyrosinisolvens TaxID=1443435 RepID=UPI00063F0072|nr:hypothetical protein [Aneurinibacillus tyrosinisolvens]